MKPVKVDNVVFCNYHEGIRMFFLKYKSSAMLLIEKR